MKTQTFAQCTVKYDNNGKSGARMPQITTPRKAWAAGARKAQGSGLEGKAGKQP